MLIKNGLIYDMVQNTPYLSDIRTEGVKILEIKEGRIPRENEEVIDAAGKNVYPGLIDAHCHIGLHEQAENRNSDFKTRQICSRAES